MDTQIIVTFCLCDDMLKSLRLFKIWIGSPHIWGSTIGKKEWRLYSFDYEDFEATKQISHSTRYS